MLERELVEADEAVVPLGCLLQVEAVVGREEVIERLADTQGRLVEVEHTGVAHASAVRGSARKAAALSASSRYIDMHAAADSQTPSMNSVRDGL